ncbi:MAG: low molecular weight phosphotyrosine protein phosphatase [Gemmatimonadales bacterium]|nr:MAG: low molecular weight phosphotyrosine protein phosphatase [Gemmatimonadales bacterium]
MSDEPRTPSRSVLFVCLGNICRSPLAEGVFEHLAGDAGLQDELRIDSAGTGSWHIGDPPDPRSIEVAQRHGVELKSRGRQVSASDFREFDLILAMDRSNLQELQQIRDELTEDEATAELRLFREFDPEAHGDLEVPDPYFGGPGGFDTVYAMVLRGCRELLTEFERD